MKSRLIRTLALILLVLVLAACRGNTETYSEAEEAVVRYGVETFDDGAFIVPWSVTVRQVQEWNADIKYVLVSFDRLTVERPEHCLLMYEAHRDPLHGWSTGTGGGSCGGPIAGREEVPALDSSSGTISDPDASVVTSNMAYYGVVNDQMIDTVRLTLENGAVLNLEVVNGSYLTILDGLQSATLIEGLYADGAVVYAKKEINPWATTP